MVLLYSSQQLESESRNSATRWENNWDEGEEIKPNHFPPSHLPNAHPDTHLWMQPGSFLNSRISEHFKEREILPFLMWIFLFYLFYRSANFGTNRNTKLRTGSKDYSQVATCASLSVRLTCTRRSSFECRVQPEVSWWSGRLFSELLRVRMADLSSRGHRQRGNNYPTNLVTCWTTIAGNLDEIIQREKNEVNFADTIWTAPTLSAQIIQLACILFCTHHLYYIRFSDHITNVKIRNKRPLK